MLLRKITKFYKAFVRFQFLTVSLSEFAIISVIMLPSCFRSERSGRLQLSPANIAVINEIFSEADGNVTISPVVFAQWGIFFCVSRAPQFP